MPFQAHYRVHNWSAISQARSKIAFIIYHLCLIMISYNCNITTSLVIMKFSFYYYRFKIYNNLVNIISYCLYSRRNYNIQKKILCRFYVNKYLYYIMLRKNKVVAIIIWSSYILYGIPLINVILI